MRLTTLTTTALWLLTATFTTASPIITPSNITELTVTFASPHITPSNITELIITSASPITNPSNTTEAAVFARQAPHEWELSNGARGAPCPGWPVKEVYNATHWREWHFDFPNIMGYYTYGLLDQNCLLSNRHP